MWSYLKLFYPAPLPVACLSGGSQSRWHQGEGGDPGRVVLQEMPSASTAYCSNCCMLLPRILALHP